MDRVCKYLSDDFSEVCVNGECEACADFCPCVNYPTICKYYVPKEEDDARDN